MGGRGKLGTALLLSLLPCGNSFLLRPDTGVPGKPGLGSLEWKTPFSFRLEPGIPSYPSVKRAQTENELYPQVE
jgi:hypothetical protein